MTDSQIFDQPPTCFPGAGWWAGMHCLHVVSRDGSDAQCCGCTEVFANPSANINGSATQGNYRIGATHTVPGPFWPTVRARMPEPVAVTIATSDAKKLDGSVEKAVVGEEGDYACG